MRVLSLFLAVFIVCISAPSAHGAEAKKIPLSVLYLERQQDERRSESFVKFLSEKFARCTAAKRDKFKPQMLQGIDVVLLDWSQQESVSAKYESPIGPLENWDTPIVLLGSAGHLLAGPWSVIGGAG